MTIARSVARSVASSVARSVAGSIGGGGLASLIAESVAFWPLDDDAASTVVTASKGSNATASTNTENLSIAGPNGLNAFQFVKASSEHVDVGTGLTNGATELTIAFWMRRDASGSSEVVFGDWQTSNSNVLIRFEAASNNLSCYTFTSSQVGANMVLAAQIPQDTWKHIAFVYDGAEQRVYVDGVEQPTTYAQSGAIGQAGDPGAFIARDRTAYGNVSLRDFGIWHRVLTVDEIDLLRSFSSYDSDAQSYFNAVEGAGGSFDLTAVSGTYTEDHVKQAHSDLFAGLKTDGVWDKITELYLLVGKTFDGITVKAKGTGALTNNNFVTGDYVAAGSGGGLKGNGSTKYIQTGFLDSSLSANDKHLSVYEVEAHPSTVSGLLLAESGPDSWGFYDLGTSGDVQTRLPQLDAIISSFSTVGFYIGSRRGVNDVEYYKNGSSIGTDTSTVAATNATVEYYVFARNNDGVMQVPTNARLALVSLGSGLSDTEAANVSTRVETFMDALGAGVTP